MYTRIRRLKGQVMGYGKDMSNVYFQMNEFALRKLRSKKVLQMHKVEGYNNWFARRDRELLSGQIMQIDAVLESRKLQLPML